MLAKGKKFDMLYLDEHEQYINYFCANVMIEVDEKKRP